jgi:hypothetical protein
MCSLSYLGIPPEEQYLCRSGYRELQQIRTQNADTTSLFDLDIFDSTVLTVEHQLPEPKAGESAEGSSGAVAQSRGAFQSLAKAALESTADMMEVSEKREGRERDERRRGGEKREEREETEKRGKRERERDRERD